MASTAVPSDHHVRVASRNAIMRSKATSAFISRSAMILGCDGYCRIVVKGYCTFLALGFEIILLKYHRNDC